MVTNEAGRELIKAAEALRLDAYRCPAGILTIGYGHTGDVEEGQHITVHQAESVLDADLDKFERAVARVCPGANENEFSAMVSLAFNIGIAAFEKSSVAKFFVMGAPFRQRAALSFSLWNKAKDPKTGKLVELPGLIKRRKAEAALFLRPLVHA